MAITSKLQYVKKKIFFSFKKIVHNTSKMQNISSEFTNVDFKIRKVYLSKMKCGNLRQMICIGKRMDESAIWEKIARQQENHMRRS